MSDEADGAVGPVFMHTRRLEPTNLFAQHDDYAALQDCADRYSGDEAVIANLFIGLTHNVAARVMAECLVGEFNGKHLDEVLIQFSEED